METQPGHPNQTSQEDIQFMLDIKLEGAGQRGRETGRACQVPSGKQLRCVRLAFMYSCISVIVVSSVLFYQTVPNP